MPTTHPDRLYVLAGGDRCRASLDAVYEADIGPDLIGEPGITYTIEEWSVASPYDDLPTPNLIVDRLIEDIADDAEYADEPLPNRPEQIDGAIEAATELLDCLADAWTFYKTDNLIDTHELLTTADGYDIAPK